MVVLDTHVLIWWLTMPDKLSRRAARALKAAKRVGVPAISTWEIALLATRGRIRLDRPTLEWLNAALATPRIELLPLTPSVATWSTRWPQGDPADRLIAATALVEGAPLVSADAVLASFAGVDVIWD